MIIVTHVYQWRSPKPFASCSPSSKGTKTMMAANAAPPKANSIINVIMVVRHPLITVLLSYLLIRYINQLSILHVIKNARAPITKHSKAGQSAIHSQRSDNSFVADIKVIHGTGAAAIHKITAIHSAMLFLLFFLFSSIIVTYLVICFLLLLISQYCRLSNSAQ